MISEQDAINFAIEYCDNEILHKSCECIYNSERYHAIGYIVDILHKDDDNNIFKSHFFILAQNGIISSWNRQVIEYGEVD